MTHPDPTPDPAALEDGFVFDYPEPKVSLTAEAADRLTVSTFNALNAIATLFWILVLLALAGGIPATVLLWRAAF